MRPRRTRVRQMADALSIASGPPSDRSGSPPSVDSDHSGWAPASDRSGPPPSDDGDADDAGGTDQKHVEQLRAGLKAWTKRLDKIDVIPSQHISMAHGLEMVCEMDRGVHLARKFITTLDRESPWLCDSRLSIMDTYFYYGLERSQVTNGHRNNLTAAERLQYLVRQQPTCTRVDWNADHGQWFFPIDDAWVFGAPDEKHGWTSSLVKLLQKRIENCMMHDQETLIGGTSANPQPAGRYINKADVISMWNKSGGKCPSCSHDIWIGYNPLLEDEPPARRRATVQRLDDTIIHLRSNCANSLLCHSCNCVFSHTLDRRTRALRHQCTRQ
jgi:hypothetical protein